jgi:Protein of unknown function (DUF2752)
MRSFKWIPLLAAVLGLAVAAGAAVVLYVFDPAGQRFVPVCKFYQMTGLQCPGCGMTRATHQLLHGRIGAAFYYNALYVALLPGLLLWAVWWVRQWWRARPLSPATARVQSLLGGAVVGAFLVFWLVRNCPGWPLM